MKEIDELVFLKNDDVFCDSLHVAEKFHKRHDNVLRAINKILPFLKNEEPKTMFIEGRRKLKDGHFHKIFYMNRDGFSLLVMGFTGQEAIEWKLKYIKAFNEMEKVLQEKSTQEWVETRKKGQVTRRIETDIIDIFVEYAKSQGSTNSNFYYTHFSNLANDSVGITNRDTATIVQLNQLNLIENIITHQIREGIEQQRYYKDIFKDCKKQINLFKEIAYLDVKAM